MALIPLDSNAPEFTRRYINLADERLGAQAIYATDAFFAPVQRMLSHKPPVFVPDLYDEHGKWMDGWETRRKRTTGHDFAIVKLMRRGVIHGVEIDTSHFTGNYPPAAAIEVCDAEDALAADTPWFPLLPAVNLQGNQHHYFAIDAQPSHLNAQAWTHVRLHLYPDGGVARLRIYGQPILAQPILGQPVLDTQALTEVGCIDLAAAEHGATVIAANNQHFGLASHLLMPGRGVTMGDGWETRRRREPGNDWCVIALAQPGVIEKIEVDTCHFKGNYPDSCSLQAALVPGGTELSLVTQSMFWPSLLEAQKLSMDAQHYFQAELQPLGCVSHVRFNIFPDGGVSRLRLWGRLASPK